MISFLDLAAVNRPYELAFQEKFRQTLQRGWWILGEEVALFEKNWANYCGTEHCIGTANGLDALTIILKAAQISGKLHKGDLVAVPANTYIATILSILQADLTPVLIEPNPNSFLVTIEELKKVNNPKVKAFVAVHLYGENAITTEIMNFCNEQKWLLFEDAAQAHGAQNPMGKRVGNLSLAAAFSFYPGKNLGALGDAGAITTSDAELAEICKALRNYGSQQKYLNLYEGVNSRLDEIQAAFLNVKWPHLDDENEHRRRLAQVYLDHISNPRVVLPKPNGLEHVWHLFVVRSQHREALQHHLHKNGVQTLIHYPIPPHQQKALESHQWGPFPITEAIHREVLSLPMGSHLTHEEALKVAEIVNTFAL